MKETVEYAYRNRAQEDCIGKKKEGIEGHGRKTRHSRRTAEQTFQKAAQP
jgi:hypothetical protein